MLSSTCNTYTHMQINKVWKKVNSAFIVIVIWSCTENQSHKQRRKYYLSLKEFMMLV